MAFVRPAIGKWLFDYFHDHEGRVIEKALDNKREPRFYGLSLKEARTLILTAEARAEVGQPKELRMWFTYSRFYLYIAWYKLYKLRFSVKKWLDRPFLS